MKQSKELKRLSDELDRVKLMLSEEFSTKYDTDYDKRFRCYRIMKEKAERQQTLITALSNYQIYLLGRIAEEQQSK